MPGTCDPYTDQDARHEKRDDHLIYRNVRDRMCRVQRRISCIFWTHKGVRVYNEYYPQKAEENVMNKQVTMRSENTDE